MLLAEREKRIVAIDQELKRVEHESAARSIRVAQLEEQITFRDQQLTRVNNDVIDLERTVIRRDDTIRRMRTALVSKMTSEEGIKALLISLEEEGTVTLRASDKPPQSGGGTPPVAPTLL